MVTQFHGEYAFISRQSSGLVILNAGSEGQQMWAKSAGTRKPQTCIIDETSRPVSTEMYRPVGNAANRMLRISTEGMQMLELEAQRKQ